MNQRDLETLISWWRRREELMEGNTSCSNYARGNADALSTIHKALFGDEGFSLREVVKMEGPIGVFK